MRRRGLPNLLAALMIFALTCPVHAGQITLYRDRLGVPAIAAGTLGDAAYGLGYATAHDDAEQMARNYKEARGRMAEIDGQSQLLQDGLLRALGIEEMAKQRTSNMPADEAALINSFCAGANRALAEQKGSLPAWIEPFTPVDVLALAQLINAAFALEEISRRLLPSTGSNQFALAPSRTAGGHALLSADPHLPWNGIFAWYAFASYTPEMSFRGVTIPGLPIGVMGHTDRVAWCMTNNDPTLYTLYKVQTNPENPKQYNFHGEMRDYGEIVLDLRYRDGDQLKSVRQTIRRTDWGPVVPFVNLAVRLTMLGDWSMLSEAQQMARARNGAEFRAALRPLGISMWNIVYADVDGHIGYQYNARVPRLDTAFDWSQPVPGSDPRTKWGDWWTLDELPHLEDPKSGVLANANSAPWLTTLDDELRPGGWPAYVTRNDHTTRYDRLAALLRPSRHVTPADARRIATDTLVPYALQAVLALRQSLGKAPPGKPLHDAMAVLAHWNGRADVGARGCALYLYWVRQNGMSVLARKAARGEAWTNEENAAALGALREAAAALLKDHSRLDVAWGAVHYSLRGKAQSPVSGFGYVVDSTAAVVPNAGAFADGAIRCVGGSSFRLIVDLDPHGVRSWSILPYGDSENPASAHYADQLPAFGRGEYADTFFGLYRIRKAAVSAQTLTSP